jgi:hypothetical protein
MVDGRQTLGLLDQPLVHQAVTDLAQGRDTRATLLTACRDPRSLLAAEPMRYLHALHQHGQPEWVAMEEVPSRTSCPVIWACNGPSTPNLMFPPARDDHADPPADLALGRI